MVRAVTPIPFVKARFFDRCGKPLTGGKVYTYEANTTTPKVTYKDPYGLTPNTNPIILDAAGEADIYLDGTYRIRITDRNDVLVNDVAKIGSWFSDNLQDTLDNISGAMDDALKPILQNLDDVINAAAAAGAGANGWTDVLVTTQNGRTQRQKNLDTVNLLDYMTANELTAYQADATTFNAAPVFNRASVDCYNKKRKLMAYGTFYTADTVVITSDCDLSQADIFTTASLAIDVRNAVDTTASTPALFNANIILPRNLKYTPKTTLGWIADTVGVKATNLYSCNVTTGRVTNFETAMVGYADARGNAYNNYYIGWHENNKVNLLLDCTDSGWVNENNFFGGRYSHNGGEGTNVSGVRHIKIAATANVINNNVFYKPSVEGNTAEYHIECSGIMNTFFSPRWEASPCKLLYSCDDNMSSAVDQASRNMIFGGTSIDGIVITRSGTKAAFLNRLIGYGRDINNISGASTGHVYRTSSNDKNIISIFNASENLEALTASTVKTNYCVALNESYLNGKVKTDAYPRIKIAWGSGRIYFGNGTAGPTAHIGSFGESGFSLATEFYPHTTGAYGLGSATYRWKQMYLSDGFGAWGATPPTTKPSVTGAKGGNAALASLITALASYGLITDNTTA